MFVDIFAAERLMRMLQWGCIITNGMVTASQTLVSCELMQFSENLVTTATGQCPINTS